MPLLTALPMIVARCNPAFPADGIRIDCATIADVARIYEEHLHITLRPIPGRGECFWLSFADDPDRAISMEIHIERDGKDQCVKNDLRFELHHSDVVKLMFKIC